MSIIEAESQAMFKRYYIGADIEYLGVKLRVIKHQKYRPAINTPFFAVPESLPALCCEYVDSQSVFREKVFYIDTWEFLTRDGK